MQRLNAVMIASLLVTVAVGVEAAPQNGDIGTVPDSADKVVVLRERAAEKLRDGKTRAAEATAKEALATSTRIHGADGWPTIAIHALLARIYGAEGRWPDAVAAYATEIALTETHLGKRHLALARPLFAYAEALRKVGREKEAQEAENRGHEIYAASDPRAPRQGGP